MAAYLSSLPADSAITACGLAGAFGLVGIIAIAAMGFGLLVAPKAGV